MLYTETRTLIYSNQGFAFFSKLLQIKLFHQSCTALEAPRAKYFSHQKKKSDSTTYGPINESNVERGNFTPYLPSSVGIEVQSIDLSKESLPKLRIMWNEKEREKLIKLVDRYGSQWKKIKVAMKAKRSANSLRTHYINVENPNIKKERWSKTEDDELRKIISANLDLVYKRNWTAIAEILGNGRTSPQVRYRYESRLRVINGERKSEVVEGLLRRGFWTKEEDSRLLKALDTIGENLKTKKFFFVHGDPNIEKLTKENYKFFNNSQAIGDSTESNKKLISESVSHSHNKKLEQDKANWEDIASLVKTRTSSQCRLRWDEILYSKQKVLGLRQKPFTEEEAELLKELAEKFKPRWSKIRLYFPDRTTRSLRYYYMNYILEKKKNPFKVKSLSHKKSIDPNDDLHTSLGLLVPDNRFEGKPKSNEELNFISTKRKKWSSSEIDELLYNYKKFNGDWILISRNMKDKFPYECLKMYKAVTKNIFS
ncbi:snRNA-activating protein complex subunit 4 [Smittium mucronatum]|uniref:snRNA-activating protein complex subunit 4 n=1 Tax=Smittium mucronatum TaxID=133383 RepID=A0A1R0GUN9_9FUNG|nr:snRNA-activating protein complex subunit 4 [Smittium mucronatum]